VHELHANTAAIGLGEKINDLTKSTDGLVTRKIGASKELSVEVGLGETVRFRQQILEVFLRQFIS